MTFKISSSMNFSFVFFFIFAVVLLLLSSDIFAATCFNPKTECLDAGGTRYFDGVSVTLKCWREKITYECKEQTDNSCQALRDQGCSPASTTCKSMWGGSCSIKEAVYDCPDRKCENHGVVCNDGKSFCLTGDCAPQERSKDTDMNKSLAALAAAAASKNFDKDSGFIFTGHRGECRHDSLGAKDCCDSSGWAKGLKLTDCDDEARRLARERAEGKATHIGRYSEKKGVPPATWKQHIEVFCIFKSKLARIIQVAGRSQLSISFGSPRSPNCRGLTPEELQKIDFSKIDFSEVYQDIQNKMRVKSAIETNKRIQEKTAEFAKDLRPVEKMKNKMKAMQSNKAGK